MPSTNPPGSASTAPPPPLTSPAAPLEALPLEYAHGAAGRASRFRWVVLGLVFFAITVNYIDRMVIGLLAPDYLKQPKGMLSESEFGYIGTAFGVCYALGQAGSG